MWVNEIKKYQETGFIFISKDIPVVHLSDDNDDLIANLAGFKGLKIWKETWPQHNIFCYFGLESDVQVLSKVYNVSSTIRHYSSVLHEIYLHKDDVMHVDFENNFMHIYIKKNQKFLYYNKLYFENEVDVHYQLSLIHKNILEEAINPPMIFSGHIDQNSKIIHALKSYFSKIVFAHETSEFIWLPNSSSKAILFDFYATASCAS
ncbi:MAG: DUF3822 family protein [Saprospiraceae bacterium]